MAVEKHLAVKPKIHPEWFEAKVTCACGETFTSYSTKKLLKVEICSKCHPLFTGKHKIVDTAGRVEKFVNKYKKVPAAALAAAPAPAAVPAKSAKPAKKAASK